MLLFSLTNQQRPTLLAKVFGCYKLTFRKTGKDKGPGKSKSMQMNLLVMENLFYDRRFSKVSELHTVDVSFVLTFSADIRSQGLNP